MYYIDIVKQYCSNHYYYYTICLIKLTLLYFANVVLWFVSTICPSIYVLPNMRETWSVEKMFRSRNTLGNTYVCM